MVIPSEPPTESIKINTNITNSEKLSRTYQLPDRSPSDAHKKRGGAAVPESIVGLPIFRDR